MENFFNSKPGEFYLRGINKLSDKWWEVIKNNCKYIIDWNSFIVKLFLYKLYFTKTEIIYDSTQKFYFFYFDKFLKLL